MKRISVWAKSVAAMLLCLVMIISAPAALAEETKGEHDESLLDILNTEELDEMVEDYLDEHNLNPENISIGYCYTATGDEYIYNGGRWYYSASMYKVPLFMIYAQKVHEGELTQDSDINGMSLADLETKVLVYSNNDYAHHAMNYLAGTPGQTHDGDRRVREMYQQFSDIPKEDYIEDFYDYSYFTPEFMMDVMETLFYESERFPNIIESLKLAQPDSYFNRRLAGKYEIAQKYGAFKEFNSTTGIIYTPNPFILTVMTEHMGVADTIIADMAELFEGYTLSLDEKLDSFRKEEEAAEQAKLEEEKKAQEEAERLEAERKAEEQRKAEEEARRIEEAQLEREKEERKTKITKISCTVLASIGVAAILFFSVRLIHSSGKKKYKAERVRPEVRETPEKTKRGAAGTNKTEAKRRGGDHYKPRH